MGIRSSQPCLCGKHHEEPDITDSSEDPDASAEDLLHAPMQIEMQPLERPLTLNLPHQRRRCVCHRFLRLLPKSILCCIKEEEMSRSRLEVTIKATLLIQRWFRRYMARLEVQRRCTWTIFQTLEYAGEQDQVKLYNFFNALLTHIPQNASKLPGSTMSKAISTECLDYQIAEESPDADEDCYTAEEKRLFQLKITFPLDEVQFKNMMDLYKKHRRYHLPAVYAAEILKRAVLELRKYPNINLASTAVSKQITICGDLHGKLDDLLVIFHKNGLPSIENPYIFNGDFVDRGKQGFEVLILLLSCILVYPGGVFLNRGNHEDLVMNSRYGFIREIHSKYRRNSEAIMKLIEQVYRHLPLGTIINNKVLVVHGGISDTTDLDLVKSLERAKYVSLLRPPVNDSAAPGAEAIDKVEWKQVFDLLWSDPQTNEGCIPNTLRGAGTYFGPDVTKRFLEKYKLLYIVRSHECKPEGYEVVHDKSVITIFSASSYYELGSNNGAYLKIAGPHLDTHYVQYMSNGGRKKLSFCQRVGLIETGAIKELHGKIMAKKEELEEKFARADPENTGLIAVSKWCEIMATITNLNIPWRMLKDKLVDTDPETRKVLYQTTFDITSHAINSVQGSSTVIETLYRHKRNLETIFHIIDGDNSGYITFDKFVVACNLINEHMPDPITKDQLEELCRVMDFNKDGKIDLNEFLESFRLVDPESRMDNYPSPQNSLHTKPESPPKSEEERPKFLDVNGTNSRTRKSPSKTVTSPPISPAVLKPIKLRRSLGDVFEDESVQIVQDEDKISIENNNVNTNNVDESSNNSNRVISIPSIHLEMKNATSPKNTNNKSKNTLNMSPVLSSRCHKDM